MAARSVLRTVHEARTVRLRPVSDMLEAPRGRRVVETTAAALSLFLTLSALGLPLRAVAQPAVILHAGASVATLGGDAVRGLSPKHRVGSTVALSITPFSFDGYWLAVAYSEKGARLEDRGADVTVKIDYMELYGLARVDLFAERALFAESSFGPYFLMGTAAGFEVGCATSGSQGRGHPLGCDELREGGKQLVDFGFVGGLGLGYDVSENAALSLEVLYNLGISSINDDDDTRNRTFMIRTGVEFPLG